MAGRRGGPVRGRRRPPLGDTAWLVRVVIGLAAMVGVLVFASNRQHAQRHEAFLAACARGGHDVRRCDFYWHTLAARAPSNDKALSLITTR
jgi:hypothetical protein